MTITTINPSCPWRSRASFNISAECSGTVRLIYNFIPGALQFAQTQMTCK